MDSDDDDDDEVGGSSGKERRHPFDGSKWWRLKPAKIWDVAASQGRGFGALSKLMAQFAARK